MAYIAPSVRATGDLVTAAIWNADVVANEIAINAGAIALASQAIGDLMYASSTTQWARIADVATGQVLISGGVGVAPSYSATTGITGTGTLVAGATGAGFTVALSTSTITGSLADARLSANVPLLNAANTFTNAGTTTFQGATLALGTNGVSAVLTQAGTNNDMSIKATGAGGAVQLWANGTQWFTITAGGQFNVASGGTAAAPAITFNSTHTGIYGAAGSAVQFAISGARKAEFNGTGLYLDYTMPTTAAAANAVVANNDYLKLSTSIRANKHDERFISLDDARHTIMGLRGILYKSRVDADQRDWAGFIADDAEKVNPVLTTYDQKGALQSFTYDRLPAYHNVLLQSHDTTLYGDTGVLASLSNHHDRLLALEQAEKARVH